jgi:hypothetical protein
VEGHEDLVSAMTNHPKDRHVLAAAVRCTAEVIVTHNLKDFPRTALEPYSITAMGPGHSCGTCMISTLSLLRAPLCGRLVEYVLERLSVNAPGFVSFFKTTGRHKPGRP